MWTDNDTDAYEWASLMTPQNPDNDEISHEGKAALLVGLRIRTETGNVWDVLSSHLRKVRVKRVDTGEICLWDYRSLITPYTEILGRMSCDYTK